MDASIKSLLYSGTVIPAHPLALTEDRQLDEARQRRLTRYYIASGAGGVAVGVHTTQFEIRWPQYNLYERVLRLAAEEIDKAQLSRPFIRVAGIAGPTAQALKEAGIARDLGYHIGLVSLGGLNDYSESRLVEHVAAVAEVIPVFGFYLQPSVGGRILSYDCWRRMADIPNLLAIKTAPFNRYQTLDVFRAVCHSERCDEIAMYTGNDDNIVADLLTTYRIPVNGKIVEKRFAGGLLGHWSVWTSKVVELFNQIRSNPTDMGLLSTNIAVTDMNAALFDPSHSFKGSIAGLHEVLRKQGLMEGTWCLSDHEVLSPGQAEEIERVMREYPEHTDDEFVRAFLEKDKI
ncbi:dihydrodipicolinate synthase family protein [Chitinophaga sp. NPDC101104]|uniref:dihydrodipicolinate synthase family protein n=1 Tax=Chitinophaga sp. NPDC101104 TaxID=3390561 RepID=UPI003CFE538A